MKVCHSLFFLICLFKFLPGFLQPAFAESNTKKETVYDYYKLLPKKFITHQGDYGPTDLSLIQDQHNGYLALQTQNKDTVFSMALFRKSNGGAILMVSNKQYDFACDQFQTFILEPMGNHWNEISQSILPKISVELFFASNQSAEDKNLALLLSKNKTFYSIELRPPRQGTQVELHFHQCDAEIENQINKANVQKALGKFISHFKKNLFLKWDKNSGRFQL